ncbi:hypothetical protein ACFO8Q_05050 [Effusibacillus consociatus]|uniref:HNH endonuclease n=2 Tax=Effusibacillus consociatus TaxID=1117041 RepID=A0ABV9PXI2_9BACL
MKRNLPSNLTAEDIENIQRKFNYSCSLTGIRDNVTLDHFIPVEWGHGGFYPGNVYPLEKTLNASKSNKNPFEWIKEVRRDKTLRRGKNIDQQWSELIQYLASENGLTVDEFKQFVKWCARNKRTVEEVRRDKRMSLEIYKEHRWDV